MDPRHPSMDIAPDLQTQRAIRLVAKARRKQLELAIKGQVEDSAKYAARAHHVEQLVEDHAA